MSTPNRKPMRKILIGAVTSLFLVGCSPQAGEPDTVDPRAVLERSATAMRDVSAIAYDFEWGSRENPSGWATGRTLMRRVTDFDDSWIRVTGTVHAQPAFGVEEVTFDYAFDGEQAWERDAAAGSWRTAPIESGANTLATNAVLGYLPEFVEARPLWKELGPLATTVLLEPEVVDGEACDVIEVTVRPQHGPPSLSIWSIARSDNLPRRAAWPIDEVTPPMIFTLTAFEVEPALTRADFQIENEDAESTLTSSGIGVTAPEFSLSTAEGDVVTLSDLSGSVAVLDFWNTWCYLCRVLAPGTRQLASELSDQPVRFLGVNVFETGDSVAYWRDTGSPFPMLLDGDELAQSLDLPWQPGVAVLGHDGTVLWKQLGASPDRAESLRASIESGLSRIPSR